MKTNFRPAYIKDFAACWKVIDQARQSMIESGRHQWTEEYPSEKDIRKDRERKEKDKKRKEERERDASLHPFTRK